MPAYQVAAVVVNTDLGEMRLSLDEKTHKIVIQVGESMAVSANPSALADAVYMLAKDYLSLCWPR